MESDHNRFLQLQQPRAPRRKRWAGCWGGLSIFRKQKGGKRIVPASRVPDSNNQPNGAQVGGLPNQANGVNLSLLAPPSSPASFSHSALPSTAQSPNCFSSINSPVGPSSNMFVTGPYAHETQLVSPPVFSTFTTEPSTAPLTPPPELAHITTPSSPDVPYARFSKIKTSDKTSYMTANDLQATYSLYPGSPASALRSPQWDPSIHSQEQNSDSGRYVGHRADSGSKSSNFFCPETFAQFYLDQSSFSHMGGRLSISRETDAHSNGGNGHQNNRQTKICKPDAEELEAYRASFGFSADEIISTPHYVEITDVIDDSFNMAPSTVSERASSPLVRGVEPERKEDFPIPQFRKSSLSHSDVFHGVSDQLPHKRFGDFSGRAMPINHVMSDDEGIYTKMGASRIGRKYHFGTSNSDAEIEYRRGRSLREGRFRHES